MLVALLTVAVLTIELLGPVICGRSKAEITERSQVLSPQMIGPIGSILSAVTVKRRSSVALAGIKHLSNDGLCYTAWTTVIIPNLWRCPILWSPCFAKHFPGKCSCVS
jgi:hypothetical protein